MPSSFSRARLPALAAACAVVALLALPGFVIAQQQVIGGHALDANLRTDGSGFNTATSPNRVSGLQSSVYSPGRASRANLGLSSPVYRAGRSTSGAVDTRYASGGYSLETGAGTFTTGRGGGRADPLRNPQYSVLQTGAYVQRGGIIGGSRTPGYHTPSTPKPVNQVRAYQTTPPGLSASKYSVSRHR